MQRSCTAESEVCSSSSRTSRSSLRSVVSKLARDCFVVLDKKRRGKPDSRSRRNAAAAPGVACDPTCSVPHRSISRARSGILHGAEAVLERRKALDTR